MHDAAARMIDAAERLAAEHGLGALTVQAVQQAAGQRNKSAVQYHFGGRQGLVEAVIATRMAPTSERRTAMLLDLGPDASTRDLVEILIVPLVESVFSRTPSFWARFLLQAISDPTTGLVAIEAIDDQALRVTQSRLEARLEHLPPALRRLRVQAIFGYAYVVLAAHEVGVMSAALSPAAVATELVDACLGLVEGPSTQPNQRSA